MTALSRSVGFLRSRRGLAPIDAERVSAWKELAAPSLRQPHAVVRYVVVDVETTGLDVRADRLIALGAAGVARGELGVGDAFSTVLRQTRASTHDNILIHRIGGEAQLAGTDPTAALIAFLEFAGKAPLVAYRAEFDRAMLARALKDTLGIRLALPWIDVALLLPALFPSTTCVSLDDWLAHFGIVDVERHDAMADAWATAELFLIALAAADRANMSTAADLVATQKAQRWLGVRR